jgi:hypothetical protein
MLSSLTEAVFHGRFCFLSVRSVLICIICRINSRMCPISGVIFSKYSFCWVFILCSRFLSTWRISKTDATTFVRQPISLRLPKRNLQSKRNWVCCNVSGRGPALRLCTDCYLNSNGCQVFGYDPVENPLTARAHSTPRYLQISNSK